LEQPANFLWRVEQQAPATLGQLLNRGAVPGADIAPDLGLLHHRLDGADVSVDGRWPLPGLPACRLPLLQELGRDLGQPARNVVLLERTQSRHIPTIGLPCLGSAGEVEE